MTEISSSLSMWVIAVLLTLAVFILFWIGLHLRQISRNLWLQRDLKPLQGLSSISDSLRDLKALLPSTTPRYRSEPRTPSSSNTAELQDLSNKVGRVGEHAAYMTEHLQKIDKSLQIIAKQTSIFLQASSVRPTKEPTRPTSGFSRQDNTSSSRLINEPEKHVDEFAIKDMESEILQVWRLFWTDRKSVV